MAKRSNGTCSEPGHKIGHKRPQDLSGELCTDPIEARSVELHKQAGYIFADSIVMTMNDLANGGRTIHFVCMSHTMNYS